MRRRTSQPIAVSAAALLVVCAPGLPGCRKEAPGRRSLTLRVVTWNIHGCTDGLDSIVNELQRLDADLICLQEAEVGTVRTGGVNQAAQIAQHLGVQEYSAGSPLPEGGHQCMAILWPDKLREPAVLDAATRRIYGVTAIIRWQRRSLRVVSVHFTSSYRADPKHLLRTSQARLAEAADLARRLREWPDDCIVAGDFNLTPGMPAYDRLATHLTGSPTTQPTYPSDSPLLPIDHVLCSNGLQVTHLTVETTRASDHLPLLAEISLADGDQ